MLTRLPTRWPVQTLFGPGLFDELFPSQSVSEGFVPAINLWSDDAAVHLEAELPGMTIEALELSVLGDQLVLKGERTATEHEGTTAHRRERVHGPFERTITLPCDVEADKVTAELQHGVLMVTLPKLAALQPRRIPVTVAGA